MFRCVLATFSQMIGSTPLSTFVICGGSASSGSRPATRDSRSRTSLAALSRSRSSVNSMLMFERSSRLAELSRSTPSMPEISFSMICVMRDSTTSDDAPRYRVSMFTTGRSTSGNSRSESRVTAPIPRMNNSSDITIAKTGRRTDTSEIIMVELASLADAGRGSVGFVRGLVASRLDLGDLLHGAYGCAITYLLRSLHDHALARLETRQHF